jgi:DNA-binding Lrp family transcriptional regulator
MPVRTSDGKITAIKKEADTMKAAGTKINVSSIAKKVGVSAPTCRNILESAGFAVGRDAKKAKTSSAKKVGASFEDLLTAIRSLSIPKDYEGLKDAKRTLEAKLEKVNAALVLKAKEIQAELKALGV